MSVFAVIEQGNAASGFLKGNPLMGANLKLRPILHQVFVGIPPHVLYFATDLICVNHRIKAHLEEPLFFMP
jgi:hypothetical protein